MSSNTHTFFKEGKQYIITRYYGKLPNGEPSMGCWGVFNISTGDMIDWSKYINDLIDKYNIQQ